MVRRGDIRWFPFPSPDKLRPVLVLTRPEAIDYLEGIAVASITTNVRGTPNQVDLTREDGMREPCSVDLFSVTKVPKAKLGRLITTLPSHKMDEVREALLFALGFD